MFVINIMSWKGVKNQTNIENIKAWCEEMGIENYTINSQGEIDVDDDVMLMDNDFKELPYKFGRVTGWFSLAYNKKLISLKNCPDYVNNSFDVDFCSKLDSLEGCPKEVDNEFYCRGCKRKFTFEEVKSLCKVKDNIIHTI